MSAGWLLPLLISWQIRSYQDTIWVQPHGELRVVEQIAVDFGDEWHHGIYRDIPVLYRTAFLLQSLGLEVLEIRRNGEPEPYRITHSGTQVRIRIGSPLLWVHGSQVYRIVYRIQRGLDFYKDHVELYFNVIGSQWGVPIQNVSAVVIPYAETPVTRAIAYLGTPGGEQVTVPPKEMGAQGVSWEAGPVMPGQAFTIQIFYPRGAFAPPPWFTRIKWGLRDNLFLLLPFLVFLILWTVWYRYGRDPIPHRSIFPRYEPPEGLHPTLAGYLMDERLDSRDITACLFELARKGWIRIEELPEKKIWIFSSRDYRLHRLKDTNQGLEPYEMEMLEALFEGGVQTVKLSSLKKRFYRNLPRIRKAIEYQALQEGLFPVKPNTVRIAFWVLAALIGGSAFALFVAGRLHLFWLGGLILTALEVAGFGQFMPRKTKKGAQLAWEVRGFYEFMKRVEADRLRRLGKDSLEHFERGLPYAVAFGLEEKWSHAFLPLLDTPPRWYVSATPGTHSFANFSASLSHTTSVFTQSLTVSPRGSGGGRSGSAGGGIGGGGGGAW